MSKNNQRNPDKTKKSLIHVIKKLFEKKAGTLFSHKQVCTLIDVRENALRKLVFDILENLCQQQFLQRHGHSVYSYNSISQFVEGTIELTARKAGFIIVENMDTDVYISPENVNHALNGDFVKVRIIKQGTKRNEGEIVEILKRERTEYIGTIISKNNSTFFIPDNIKTGTDIFIPKEKLKNAKHEDKVIVKITVWPKSSKNPYGEVINVLGKSGTNEAEMISILSNYGIDYVFPTEVLNEAEKINTTISNSEIKQRRDFRSTTTFTIDPVDAKDFDDALSFKHLENGNLEIGVHIADVSHYVTKGSSMDKEALKRSNSVYLVDRVIPMLPEELSNVVCSLRPNEDKLCFSAVFELNEEGKIYNQWLGKTIIHSNHRFSYEEAQEIIEGKENKYKKEILTLDKIAKTLREKRIKNGALNIESEEIRFKLNEKGEPIDVIVKTSKDAHKLIEEFMLLANKKVAMFIAKRKKEEDIIPFIYRVHDKPDNDKIALFNVFIGKFGYKLDFSDPSQIAKNINKLLTDIHLKNEYSLIQTMAIRSMSKATYETINIGHYGLAFDFYTHFTSPIRRYADLIVHRILEEELTTKKHKYGNELNDICKRISRMERKAIDAERESTKYFQTLLVSDKIGKEYTGTISGIADFGIFVKIDENYCEGLIPINEISTEKYYFDNEKFSIIGTKTKNEFNFGDKVKVKIENVNVRKKQIDLSLVQKQAIKK